MTGNTDGPRSRSGPTGYWERAKRPLQSLVFLLPLLIVYEIGAITLLRDAGSSGHGELVAVVMLREFFNFVGIEGLYLPGLVVVVVLLCWHIAEKDPWRLEPETYLGMLTESIVWAVPLWVLLTVLSRHAGGPVEAAQASTGAGDLTLAQSLLLSLGAGIYEELVYRLIGITLVHLLLVDLLKMPKGWGAVLAVIVTSLAFGYVHFNAQHPFELGKMIVYTIAGAYFAVLFVMRGFGIAAGTHAVFDVIVFTSAALLGE